MDDETTQLFSAASSGDVNEVQRLISSGVDLNAKNGGGLQAIHIAVINGHREVVEALISSGKVYVDSADPNCKTPLHLAIEYSSLSCLEFLVLKKASYNSIDENGNTPMHKAFEKLSHCLLNEGDINCGLVEEIRDCVSIKKILETFKSSNDLFVWFSIIQLLKENGESFAVKNKIFKSPLDLLDANSSLERWYFKQLEKYSVLHSSCGPESDELILAKSVIENAWQNRNLMKSVNLLQQSVETQKIEIGNLQAASRVSELEMEKYEHQLETLNGEFQGLLITRNEEKEELKRALVEKTDYITSNMQRFEELLKTYETNETKLKEEMYHLKARIDFLESCPVCRQAKSSFKVLCGQLLCDNCNQNHDCGICFIIRNRNRIQFI